MQIAIIDLGVGNLRSVEQALNVVAPNASVIISSDENAIDRADRVVLPGQGAIGTWFQALQQKKLETVVRKTIAQKPLLAICVGMQALFSFCEEDGGVDGLGIYPGSVKHFANFHHQRQSRLKIPQMGWNQLRQSRAHPLWHGVADNSHFYFVHSYCANLSAEADLSCVLGTADYGHEFVAAVGHKNIFAVQFHPEKSHDDGLRLLSNFTQWNPVD